MTDSAIEHRARAWRVHELASDFDLVDFWKFDLGRSSGKLEDFLDCFWETGVRLAKSRLARARLRIGSVLRWDDHDFSLPIPGCNETTVAERLSDADRAANRAAPDAPSPFEAPVVKTVYRFDDEALFEFSNDTIHGLLHVGMMGAPSENQRASLAVYVKHRGVMSHLYMAAIKPARHWIVYPALIREVENAWKRKESRSAASVRRIEDAGDAAR